MPSILFETSNHIAHITLNRPDKVNAFNRAMALELQQVLDAAAADENVRAIYLTGSGKAFCAGQDLDAFASADIRQPNRLYEHLMAYYKPMVQQLRTMGKLVIAAINGPAAGAGMSLALACDLRIMSDKAFLMQAFSNIGLIPDAGGTWLLARQVGYSRALQLSAEAERIPADVCLSLGLTNKVVTQDVLLTEAMAWAIRLAQRPTAALALTKRAMNKTMETGLMEMIDYEAHLQQLASETEDFIEGTAATREKRAAKFTGR